MSNATTKLDVVEADTLKWMRDELAWARMIVAEVGRDDVSDGHTGWCMEGTQLVMQVGWSLGRALVTRGQSGAWLVRLSGGMASHREHRSIAQAATAIRDWLERKCST